MSQMDGIVSAKDLVKKAASFGHEALATDHSVVQSFPEAHFAGLDTGENFIRPWSQLLSVMASRLLTMKNDLL